MRGDENAHAYAEQALKKTVNLDDAGFVVTHRLAPREINLVIEYSAGLDKKKRQEQLCQLLRYADNNRIDGRNLVLYYPKLVCVYVSEFIDDNKENPEWLSWTLRMVHRAAKCLLDTNRLIYALELTEIKDLIWNNILNLEDCENALGYDLFLENKKKNAEEHDLWLDLGRIYGIEIRTIDWCYLYREEGVKCIGDIIRRRRKMMGMSKEELCMDICSFDTLERIEKLKVNPQPKRMLKLLERLNLAGEYQKTLVSVTNSETKLKEERIAIYSNKREYDKALEELYSLKDNLKEKRPEDEQFFLMIETMIRQRKQEISVEELPV